MAEIIEDKKEEFELGGVKWLLETKTGDVLLWNIKKKISYALDRPASSVFNISFVLLALGDLKTNPSNPNFIFAAIPHERKYVMQIITPHGPYTYLFKERFDTSSLIKKVELEELMKIHEENQLKIPITGIFVPTTWKEYGPQDYLVNFDYSFLNLKKVPCICTMVDGRTGYCTVKSPTLTSCILNVHFEKPLAADINFWMADKNWKILYTIFQDVTEEKVEPTVEKAPLPKEDFTSYDDILKAVDQGRKLVIFEDKVIDLQSFLEKHPGGGEFFQDSMGKEIGRWIYGTGLSNKFKHMHNSTAIDLIEKYKIGTIHNKLTPNCFEGLSGLENLPDYTWKLAKKERLNYDYTIVRLTNPDLKFVTGVQEESWFTRYFAITSLEKKITRNYAVVQSGDAEVIKNHFALLTAMEEKADFSVEPPNPEKLNTLPIIVKKELDFSEWLSHHSSEGTEFKIKGVFVISFFKSS